HRSPGGARRPVFHRRQDRYRPGVLDRPDREIQREGGRGAPARPRAVRRLRAGRRPETGGRRAGRERRRRQRRGRADRARDLRRLPGPGAAAMIYGELGASRTKRTVTGMARLLKALRLDGMLLSGLAGVSLFGLFVLYSAAGDNTALWLSQLV